MQGYKQNIENLTKNNTNFRQVVHTSKNLQLVLMTLKPLEDIGSEVHVDTDQFFRFESGWGKVEIDRTTYEVTDGDAIVVPQGSQHNVINTSSSEDLKFYTIYTPPHHRDGVVHATKHDAETDTEEFDGKTSE